MGVSPISTESLLYCVEETGVPRQFAEATLGLLLNEGATIPFVARYRKEVTGNLDEVKIQALLEAHGVFEEREKRRAFILETLQKLEILTPDLESQVKRAKTITELEDLYAPYKSKKKTKAMLALEKGLLPLAEMILSTSKDLLTLEKSFTPLEQVPTFAEALQGAMDIIIEKMSHHLDVKNRLRELYWTKAILVSQVKPKALTEFPEEAPKYKDFFDFKETIQSLRRPEAGHRFLAMRRGLLGKILKVEVDIDREEAISVLSSFFYPEPEKLGLLPTLQKCADRAFELFIHPSLDLEIKTELKQLADEAAIGVFAVNLKNLLLSPYLGAKTVMGVDPGVRTGCKIVVIDKSGKFLEDLVIYPHPPREDREKSQKVVSALIERYGIEYIAIGNGTYGRETLSFFEEEVPLVREGKVKATMISEAGASIYSASEVARLEFPDKDTTVRGAISIARRFQDPLAELVKIDPKSIGVGQYQHDVNASKLKKSLEQVVESCVNYVGVDLNTASAPLLSYVSGIGPKVALYVVQYRQEKGPFKKREELLAIPKFGQKVFEQSAGFLRIYNGENPLDATFIHPERYAVLEDWAKKHEVTLEALVKKIEVADLLEKDKSFGAQVGELTFKDMVTSLKAPTQDPRTIFKSVEFSKQLKSFSDLKEGEWYLGVVTNITRFGAFVDIGIKENGLVHLSELSDHYVENPLTVVKVGQELKVRVINIDHERKRVGLSCKTGEKRASALSGGDRPMNKQEQKILRQQKTTKEQFHNSAFDKLKNWNR